MIIGHALYDLAVTTTSLDYWWLVLALPTAALATVALFRRGDLSRPADTTDPSTERVFY